MRFVLAVASLLVASCGTDKVPPFCPLDGGPKTGTHSDLICGACSAPDNDCPPDYICTSKGECVWFRNGFPLDAGP